MIKDNLLLLGLSSLEADVFESLLSVGPCFVAPLVQKTKKHRQMIYNSLERLEKKKLITVTKKNGKNFYHVGDPDRFIFLAKQQLVFAQQVSTSIQRQIKKESERVEVFEGSASYEQGLADFRRRAEEAKEYIVIGGEAKEWYELNRPIFPSHVEALKKLKRQGIDIFILFYESERKSAEEYIKPYLHDPYIGKIMPDVYRLPQTSWIAGNHVYLLTPTVEPLVISIKSTVLSKQYRDFFWRQWHLAEILT